MSPKPQRASEDQIRLYQRIWNAENEEPGICDAYELDLTGHLLAEVEENQKLREELNRLREDGLKEARANVSNILRRILR